jgi:hypothetical protein
MREGLISRLEQLSVYQHQPNSVNPMVLSHRIVSLRGTIFHILSRTLDAGLDYTNRTNFIAHHVIFQPHELHGACSPADYLLHWPGWLSSWESDPAWTDDQAASLHTVQSLISLPAQNWDGWSGNASNASLLFESSKAREAALIVEPGQESSLVYLFAESVLLLSKNEDDKVSQWQVPFTTFFQSKDEVSDFRWRGIWPEVNRAKAERGALLLDFRNPSVFPPATGPLAEWAATGIAPTPSFKPEMTVGTEKQMPDEEEEKPSSELKSKQVSTVTVSRSSRKRTQSDHFSNASGEELQPWYWEWKWVILAGLAVIAMAIGIAIAMLTTPKVYSSQSMHEEPQFTEKSVVSIYPAVQPTNNTAQTTIVPPLIIKPLAPPHKDSTLASGQTNPASTTSTFKDETTPSPKSNVNSTVPLANQAIDEKAVLLSKTLDSLPHGDTYLILKDINNVDSTTLPNDLASKLMAWRDECHYSISTSGFMPVGNSSPIPTEEEFALIFDKGRQVHYSAQMVKIDNQTLDETFYIRFKKNDALLSIIIIDAAKTGNMFHLSKSLLEIGTSDVSVDRSLATYLASWKIYGPDLKPLTLQLQLTTSKGTLVGLADNSFTISWKDKVTAAQNDLSQQIAREKTDEQNVQIEKYLHDITFAAVQSPLNIDSKDKDLSTFAKNGATNSNSKYPLLVNYAHDLLSSLRSDRGQFKSDFDLPPTTDTGAGKDWLAKVSSDVQEKLEAQGKTFDDEDATKLNASITTFSALWKANFVDYPHLNDLLKITSAAVQQIINSPLDLASVKQQIEKDNKDAEPIHLNDIQSIGLIMTPPNSTLGNPLVSFDAGTGVYIEANSPGSGGSK